MSIELKEAAEKALVVLVSATSFMSRKARDQHESVVAELRTAIQQAGAQQPAESAPVLFVSPEQARAVTGKNRAHYTPSDNSGRYLPVRATPAGLFTQPLYTHPAPGVPDALKDHQIAAMVNKVRDIARMFHDHQSLRERIAIELVPALKASQEVKSNAERWLYAIADGGNQSMNFIDIFGGWDGDGDFVEHFDAARLAANEGSK